LQLFIKKKTGYLTFFQFFVQVFHLILEYLNHRIQILQLFFLSLRIVEAFIGFEKQEVGDETGDAPGSENIADEF